MKTVTVIAVLFTVALVISLAALLFFSFRTPAGEINCYTPDNSDFDTPICP